MEPFAMACPGMEIRQSILPRFFALMEEGNPAQIDGLQPTTSVARHPSLYLETRLIEKG